MSVFVAFAGGRRRYEGDESGSAPAEWTMAVALVILAAFSIMSMIGKGSETRSGDIATSIAETDHSDGVLPVPASGEAPPVEHEELLAASGAMQDVEPRSSGYGPGAELGIGFSAGIDHRGGDYRRMSARRTEPQRSKLAELRRADNAAPASLPVASSRTVTYPAAPEKAGIILPTLPIWRAGFAQNACLNPIDYSSIGDARFAPTLVASSER